MKKILIASLEIRRLISHHRFEQRFFHEFSNDTNQGFVVITPKRPNQNLKK